MQGKKVHLVWVFVTLVLGVGLGLAGSALSRLTRPAPIVIEPPLPTPTALPSVTPGPLRVYVSGQVWRADVYELPPGSVVGDAIEAADGFTGNAATTFVNLAQPLVDGMHIHVPHREETTGMQPAILSLPDEEDRKININLASQTQLETLPGIGPVTAQKIIAHREEHGAFDTIEDIMDVSGIGPAKFEQMKEFIKVD